MVSRCANSFCSASFRYLHEGKLFCLEVASREPHSQASRDVEYFWLCGQCATQLRVAVENGRAVVLPRWIGEGRQAEVPHTAYGHMLAY
jgi:hypothetical protein